jgi:pimeloyl-ACP methyl ester carboxylesterase
MTELVRRMVSPLTGRRFLREAKAAGKDVDRQPVDLAWERFALYVPESAPPQGYALLVFIPPWPQAVVPKRWPPILDRHGMIFVTAANSGNDALVVERREPLALLAAHNVMARYPVDRNRVFIAGLSGGAKVALRLAIAYPEIFHGALLNAGSERPGDGIPIPPADLFKLFQETGRLVYLTGEEDRGNLTADLASRAALEEWCFEDADTETIPHGGHELAGSAWLDQALTELARHVEADPGSLAACRAGIDAELAVRLGAVDTLIRAGKRDEAVAALVQIDAKYGGWAATAVTALADRLGI